MVILQHSRQTLLVRLLCDLGDIWVKSVKVNREISGATQREEARSTLNAPS